MLGLRWLKRTVFLNRDNRRYIGYAVGEIFLVIVGILIALQIDNWNSERQDRAAVDNYLRTIAGNMQEDIHMLEALHASRSETILLALNASNGLLGNTSFNAEEILYLSQAMRNAERVAYFNANTSGFDALKNSGMLGELQGMDVEMLLSRYYVGSARIAQLEQTYNARILAAISLPIEVPSAPVEWFALQDPTALQPGRFEELQEFYSEYYSGRYPERLLDTASDMAPIVREYEKLLALARLVTEMAEAGSYDFDEHARRILADIDAVEQGAGHSRVVQKGKLSLGQYRPGFAYPYYADGHFVSRQQYIDHDYASHGDGALQINVKRGLPWAVFFFDLQDRSNTLGRPSADFTRFDRILLELKGANGGERLLLHMKDKDDPDDGSQTNLEIVLSEQWETYEFDLADFENADISKLSLVLGFLLLNQADSFSFAVRTIQFLESEE